MKAMILAAGRGERMRPLTDSVPKPLLKVGDKALIVWHLERLERAGFADIVINHAWLGSLLEATLRADAPKSLGVAYSPEGEALETAGGIANALPLITTRDEPFLVVNFFLSTMINLLFSFLHRLKKPLRIENLPCNLTSYRTKR